MFRLHQASIVFADHRPWAAVFEGRFPHVNYFVGGVANPIVNLIDRHLAKGAGNRLALVWQREDGQARFFTYRMLAAEVNKCANVFRRLGLAEGDAVAIFTPNLRGGDAVLASPHRIEEGSNSWRDRAVRLAPIGTASRVPAAAPPRPARSGGVPRRMLRQSGGLVRCP
jgi:hypothetical protein